MSESEDLKSDDENIDNSELQDKLVAAEEKAKENYELALRFKAEAENTKRRAAIDLENAHKYGSERFARELLNVLDSFEKGLEVAIGDNQQVKAIFDGMELTYKLLLDTMEKFGIKMLDPKGKAFDPKFHEALSMQETSDFEPNHVISVIQKGFTIHERVLRPARVIVSKMGQQHSQPKIDEKA